MVRLFGKVLELLFGAKNCNQGAMLGYPPQEIHPSHNLSRHKCLVAVTRFKLGSQKIGIGKRYDKELYEDFPPSTTLFSFCLFPFCLFVFDWFVCFVLCLVSFVFTYPNLAKLQFQGHNISKR